MACEHCKGEPEAGWIEQTNNGPIVPCPACNQMTEKEIAWDKAERQRELQRANHNAIQAGNTAKHEARLKLAIIKADTDRIERMTR